MEQIRTFTVEEFRKLFCYEADHSSHDTNLLLETQPGNLTVRYEIRAEGVWVDISFNLPYYENDGLVRMSDTVVHEVVFRLRNHPLFKNDPDNFWIGRISRALNQMIVAHIEFLGEIILKVEGVF